MAGAASTKSPRERIIDTAYRLFYEQGYLTTGVNQIIEEAGVSKATFYKHFPSKEDLCLVYAQERDRREWDAVHALMAPYRTPEERFLGPLKMLPGWLEAVGYRGCCFQNLISELTAADHPARKEASRHKDEFKRWLRALTIELIESSPKYADLNVDHVAETYALLYEGCLLLAELHASPEPVEEAIKRIKALTRIEE